MRNELVFAILSLAAGCSASSNGNLFGNTGSGGSEGTGASGAGGHTGTTTTGLTIDAGPMTDGGPMGPAEVFGQTATTLYKLDPNTKVVTTVGNFGGCDTVIDIALDKDGNMFATTSSGVYKVDKTNAHCTFLASGSYPNSLSFVPKGTLDPNVEALVGYVGSTYVRIDTTTGAVTNVGSLGNNGYVSSGDVVSVIGGGTYLTVNGNNCNDCIVQVDPKTGAMIKKIGALAYPEVFGLAYWGGSAYGFSAAGVLFEIDLTTAACTVIPSAMMGIPWYGAGSTTSAPIVPTM
jgi:hypothetical protein